MLKGLSEENKPFKLILPKKPHCFHQPECPVVIEAVNKQLSDCESQLPAIRRAERERIRGIKNEVVCLCGSTRFTDIMLVKQWELTKQGCIVLSWCALPDWYFEGDDKAHVGDQEGVKELVDEVHKRKIDLADRVFVINKDGYIGKSTRSEIDYALLIGKPVEYMEPLKSELLGETNKSKEAK